MTVPAQWRDLLSEAGQVDSVAADIFREMAAGGRFASAGDVVIYLAEKALLQAAESRQRSAKGAMGQKLAADQRRKSWEATAKQLMANRLSPFPSYRALAAAVASKYETPGAQDTIRKHLAAAHFLE